MPPHHHWWSRKKGDGADGSAGAPAPKAEFRYLDPKRVRVIKLPGGSFRAEITEERSILRVRFLRAFPVSHRSNFIELRDGAGRMVGMLKGLEGLDAGSLECVRDCLDGHYFIPAILEVYSLREAFEMQAWHVRTDRGELEFSVSDINRNVRHVPLRRLLITDTDQNIYEIPDWFALDLASRLRIKDISQVTPEGK